MYPYQTKNRHHTGTVTNESKVVNTTHFVAKASSFLYLEAITAVTLAAGIAAIASTDTINPGMSVSLVKSYEKEYVL